MPENKAGGELGWEMPAAPLLPTSPLPGVSHWPIPFVKPEGQVPQGHLRGDSRTENGSGGTREYVWCPQTPGRAAGVRGGSIRSGRVSRGHVATLHTGLTRLGREEAAGRQAANLGDREPENNSQSCFTALFPKETHDNPLKTKESSPEHSKIRDRDLYPRIHETLSSWILV